MRHFVLVCAVLSGCVEAPDTGEAEQDVKSQNRLSSNALSANRLSSNRLSSNGLAAAASASTLTDLASTSDGRELLTYFVSCALPAGQSITATDTSGVKYTFAGALGLAPNWYSAAPSVADRHWVSACLMARTNAYGVTVPISMRGTLPALAVTSTEKLGYPNYEGAFFGDLWAPDPRPMLTCDSHLASSDPSLSTFPLRQCSSATTIGALTQCGFTWVGNCESDCTAPKNGGITCKDRAGVVWNEVIQVYLAK